MRDRAEGLEMDRTGGLRMVLDFWQPLEYLARILVTFFRELE